MKKNLLQTALITGGAKRLGARIALKLANMGYDIVIHYNNSGDLAKKLQKKIKKNGVNCTLLKADLLDKKQVNNLVKELRKLKNWSVLINNASIFYQSNFLTSSADELEKNLTIHLKIPAILSREFAFNCKKNYQQGNIINMIDKNITRWETKYFDYILSKKALAEFTKILALQLAPRVRVNGIAPGVILNSINEKEPDVETQNLITKIPLRKKASPKDITSAVEYLLTNNFITGQILFIDGGTSLNHAG